MPAHAVEADGAVAAFVDRINATVGPVKPGDRKAIRAACATLVGQAFDIDAMAPDIVAEAWERMDAGQRAAYARGLARRAAADCASHGSEIAGNAVELVGVRAGEGGDRLIAVRQSKGRGRTVIWRVRAVGRRAQGGRHDGRRAQPCRLGAPRCQGRAEKDRRKRHRADTIRRGMTASGRRQLASLQPRRR